LNEEPKDPEKTAGRAATMNILVIVLLYMMMALEMLA
jgi:hypothetical protein